MRIEHRSECLGTDHSHLKHARFALLVLSLALALVSGVAIARGRAAIIDAVLERLFACAVETFRAEAS